MEKRGEIRERCATQEGVKVAEREKGRKGEREGEEEVLESLRQTYRAGNTILLDTQSSWTTDACMKAETSRCDPAERTPTRQKVRAGPGGETKVR